MCYNETQIYAKITAKNNKENEDNNNLLRYD